MRGKPAPKRDIKPDPKYQSKTIAKFINYIMKNGKKSVAQKIVYTAFDLIRQNTKQDPLGIFNKAMKNIAPYVEVRSRRVGGANYQIPYQVKGDRKLTLGFRWLIGASKSRKGAAMAVKLQAEILAALNGEGSAVKKRQDVEKMAQSNRAFAHFAR